MAHTHKSRRSFPVRYFIRPTICSSWFPLPPPMLLTLLTTMLLTSARSFSPTFLRSARSTSVRRLATAGVEDGDMAFVSFGSEHDRVRDGGAVNDLKVEKEVTTTRERSTECTPLGIPRGVLSRVPSRE